MKPPGLSINAHLVNLETTTSNNDAFQLNDTTFRQDGVTIGRDYLRLEGATLTRGELVPDALESSKEILGRGAFSTVYKTLWKRPSSDTLTVAVKEFPIIDSSLQRQTMLLQELKALGRVQSTTLVQLHGAFLHQDKATMVLEYMDLGSLDTILAKRKLDDAAIAPIAYQILQGLDELHENRMLHRDLKPANALLSSNGAVKLCDFGMASLGEQSLHRTVVGTTKWMAPERLRAEPYGRSSDVWSFGLIALECATGKTPFPEINSIVELLVTVEEMNVEDLLPEQIHSGFRELILGSLQATPGTILSRLDSVRLCFLNVLISNNFSMAEKRMPAKVLLHSPWFSEIHKIYNLESARTQLRGIQL